MQHTQSQGQRARLQLVCAIALAALLPLGLAQAQAQTLQTQAQTQTETATGGALERVRAAGKLVFGYRTDSQPMSYRDASGHPAGYAVTLCQKIADNMKAQLQLPTLAVEWVAVTATTGVQAIQQGKIDLLCAADAVTLAQRKAVSFSAPIFPGGIAALIRTNAPEEFQRILKDRPTPYKPIWRGTPPAALQHKTASVVVGTPAVELLTKRVSELKIITTISTEESYAAGVAKVVQGKSDVLLGDRAELLAQAKLSPNAGELKVLNRHFTYTPLALTLPRNDDDFRLAVDRALADIQASPKFGELYESTFGTADADTIEFFRSIPR